MRLSEKLIHSRYAISYLRIYILDGISSISDLRYFQHNILKWPEIKSVNLRHDYSQIHLHV